MARTDLQHIRDWLKALGSLCAGAASPSDASSKIAAYAPLLAADYPQAAFGPASLAAIARQCKFFPSYAELCEHLSAWWKENRPKPEAAPALYSPNRRTPAEWRAYAEQSWRDVTAADVREKIRNVQALEHGPQRASLGRLLAHAITTHAPHHAALLPLVWLQPEPERTP